MIRWVKRISKFKCISNFDSPSVSWWFAMLVSGGKDKRWMLDIRKRWVVFYIVRILLRWPIATLLHLHAYNNFFFCHGISKSAESQLPKKGEGILFCWPWWCLFKLTPIFFSQNGHGNIWFHWSDGLVLMNAHGLSTIFKIGKKLFLLNLEVLSRDCPSCVYKHLHVM